MYDGKALLQPTQYNQWLVYTCSTQKSIPPFVLHKPVYHEVKKHGKRFVGSSTHCFADEVAFAQYCLYRSLSGINNTRVGRGQG